MLSRQEGTSGVASWTSEVKQLVLGAKQDQQRGRQVNGKSAHAPDQQNEDKNLPYTQPDFNESDNNIQPEVTGQFFTEYGVKEQGE